MGLFSGAAPTPPPPPPLPPAANPQTVASGSVQQVGAQAKARAAAAAGSGFSGTDKTDPLGASKAAPDAKAELLGSTA